MVEPMAHPLEGAVKVPDKVAEIAGDDAVEGVWRNEMGGLTFRIRGANRIRYVKWQRYTGLDAERKADVDLTAEAQKLRWAGRFARVPRVLEHGEADNTAWLVTEGIEGQPASDSRWQNDPETAVRAIAAGLRQLHDTLPVAECPYRGAWLGSQASAAPEPQQLVVCHGDPCVPNTLIDEKGDFAGHVDVGQLGTADRWADLAIATYSISWEVNFGRAYDELFCAAYGVTPDYERIRAYRELWDAT